MAGDDSAGGNKSGKEMTLRGEEPLETPSLDEDGPEGTGSARDAELRDLRVPTWELELLISGAVVFTLFRVPSLLARELAQAILHFPESLFLLVFLGVIYLQTAAYVLTGAFVFHLAARAYWIGLIGLYSIFPEGIGWDNLKTGPRQRDIYRQQIPETPVMIERAGALCSGIFSFSFSVVIIILYSAFGACVIFGTGLALQVALFPSVGPQSVLYVFLGLIFFPYLGLQALDKLFSSRTLSPRMERTLRGGLDFYSSLFASKLVNNIQLTFFSNVKRRYVYPIFYVLFLGSMVLTFGRVTLDLGIVEVSGFDHFPPAADQVVAQTAYYRDQSRPDDSRSALRPSIQSDVVDGRYVKLFLPHTPRHNEALAEACPKLEPLRGRGVVRLVPRDSDLDPDLVEETRRCLAALWRISLDGSPLGGLHYEFHVREPLAVRGLLTYLPTEPLAPGRHLLRLERMRGSKDDESSDAAGEIAEDDVAVYEIPFWV